MFKPIPDTPTSIVAFDAIGTISDQDYKNTLVPAIENALKQKSPLRLLMRFGSEFETYTAHAAWDDTLLGIKHLRDFERIAIVSDIGWLNGAVRLFSPLIPAEIGLFNLTESEQAMTWVGA